MAQAAEREQGVPQAEEVQAVTDRAEDTLDALFPAAWKEQTDESDYDLIALTLDRMEAAVGAAEYKKAEQARLPLFSLIRGMVQIGWYHQRPEIKPAAFEALKAFVCERCAGFRWDT